MTYFTADLHLGHENILEMAERPFSCIEEIEGHMTTICHYPMLEWRSSRKENSKRLGFLIHGHIHKNTEKPEYMQLFRLPNALNAGVDINGFRPVTFEELLKNNSAFKHDILKGTADNEVLSEREENLKKWL